MKSTLSIVLIIVGAAIALVGLTLLPGDRGRLEYVIAITDPRPLSQGEMPAGLKARGALEVALLEKRGAEEGAARLMLVPKLARLLRPDDCALGVPPEAEFEAAAGAATGVKRGSMRLGDRSVKVVAELRDLGPLFDGWVLLERWEELERGLGESGWEGRRQYLLLTESWERRGAVLARLEGEANALPAPEAQILSPGRRPAVPRGLRLALAAALVCGGAFLMARQLRGMSREEIARRFRGA